MVSWAWIPIALIAGIFFGMLIIAIRETAQDEDDKGRRRQDG